MLNRLTSWWARKPAAPDHPDSSTQKIVQLRPAPMDDGSELPEHVQEGDSQRAGLLEEHDIRAFFDENWFGLGRHNGATYRTRESLDRGRASVIARFQNATAHVVARREVKIRRLKDKQIEIDGISGTTSRRLQQAIEFLEVDNAKLQAQIAEASHAQGWVADAVLKYEAGFAKGLYEAVAVELHCGSEQ